MPYYSEFSAVVGSFLYALILSALWLGICRIFPPLRKRHHVSYGVAMAVSVASLTVIIFKGYFVHYLNIMGALVCTCLILWRYRYKLGKAASSHRNTNE